ncbi:UNKNOWN [Stylonychia lemnae]|uniref:Uncharacterized protein n=1 Tax=Stylonychia lemnae TaxID=5949 RepID=A0A078AGX3_STYLE|nr:UNKNOWN [Stylonychia lemnae]|eukprot:CDW80108.1 UNKNOWN [Stylonychia lemnae]
MQSYQQYQNQNLMKKFESKYSVAEPSNSEFIKLQQYYVGEIKRLQQQADQSALSMSQQKNLMKQKDLELNFYKSKVGEQRDTIKTYEVYLNELQIENSKLRVKIEMYEKQYKLLVQTLGEPLVALDDSLSQVNSLNVNNSSVINSSMNEAGQKNLSEIQEKFTEEFQTHSSCQYQNLDEDNETPLNTGNEITIQDQYEDVYKAVQKINLPQNQARMAFSVAKKEPFQDITNIMSDSKESQAQFATPLKLSQVENISPSDRRKIYKIDNNRANMRSLSQKLRDQKQMKTNFYFRLDVRQVRQKFQSQYTHHDQENQFTLLELNRDKKMSSMKNNNLVHLIRQTEGNFTERIKPSSGYSFIYDTQEDQSVAIIDQ